MKISATVALFLEVAGLAAAATMSPDPRAELQSEVLDSNHTMSISQRDEEDKWRGKGRLVCGIYANAEYHKFIDLVYDMDNKDKEKKWTIGGNECNRVSCYDTSALYVCNDNKHSIELVGKQIAIAFAKVRKYCCLNGPRTSSKDNFINGQHFTPWGWNVNAGYGNCNDPVNIRPNNALGWGVNPGKCPAVNQADIAF